METDFFFQTLLDAIEGEEILLTPEQVDIIQKYASKLANELEIAE